MAIWGCVTRVLHHGGLESLWVDGASFLGAALLARVLSGGRGHGDVSMGRLASSARGQGLRSGGVRGSGPAWCRPFGVRGVCLFVCGSSGTLGFASWHPD